jgi:hypothetical protein
MKHVRRNVRSFAAVAAMSLALAACGAADDDPTASDGTAVEQTDTPSETGMDATESEMEGSETEMEMSDAGASGNPFVDLRTASSHVGWEGSARTLAGGIATAAGLEGDIDSAAAQTYAQLAYLLQEHVYLAGIAVDVAVLTSPDDPRFEAAAAALDENSVALADLIGSVAPDQRDAFLGLWREHIGFFVDYTLAVAGGDADGEQAALDSLDGYRSQAGAFFEEISGGAIPADAVASSLQGHIETLTTAIDAAVAGDTTVFSELKRAATHVGEGGSAKALASGLATALELDGDIEAPAVQAYVTLSQLLSEHVYLASTAVVTAYAQGAESDAFGAAAATLDENSVELSELIGSVAPDQQEAFLGLWREHIGFFVDYAVAVAGGDDDAAQAALDSLDGYRSQAGAFFEQVSGGELPADAVAEGLQGHIETLTTVIDGAATAFAG